MSVSVRVTVMQSFVLSPLILCFPHRLPALAFQLVLSPPLFLPHSLPWRLSEGTGVPLFVQVHCMKSLALCLWVCMYQRTCQLTCEDFLTTNIYVTGEEGPSLMGLEDIAMFRALPTATIFYPSDGVSTEKAVELAATTKVFSSFLHTFLVVK